MPSIVVNILIVLLTIIGWLQILFRGDNDSRNLSQRGWASLRYFTVLSNLFSALASAAYLAAGIMVAGSLPNWLVVLKLMGATSVTITLLTVLVFLGPRMGWRRMFSGGNLWLHLVLPLLAIFDCCLFVPTETLPFWATLMSFIPVLIYGLWYITTVFVKGTEKNGVVYDFYGFFTWGTRGLIVMVVIMLVTTWLASLLLWWL